MNPLRLEDIRTRAEAFLTESRKEWYEVGAGLKEDVRLSEIFARYADLFTRENIHTLRSLADSAEGEAESTRLSELRGFLTLGHIRDALKDLSEQALLFETKTMVETPEGESIPYRQSAVALLNEPDRENRNFLENARSEALAQKNEFLQQIHHTTHEMADDLGFKGYLGMMAALKRYPLEPVHKELDRFLGRTGELYAEAMEEELSRADVPPASAQRHDAQYCFRRRRVRRSFPGGENRNLGEGGLRLDGPRSLGGRSGAPRHRGSSAQESPRLLRLRERARGGLPRHQAPGRL